MTPQPRILASAAICALALACGRSPAGEGKTAAAVRSAAASVLQRFRPPADGVLTEAQIDRYLRVRHAARGRSDRDAARALGVDPEEFAWVRARIIEALVELETRRVRAAADATYARALASLRESRRGVKSGEAARSLDEQIAAMERERNATKREEPSPPAVIANARKITPHRAEIESVSP